MGSLIIGIDQSTQGTKALILDGEGKLVGRASLPHHQIVNEQGWVSHDPTEIWHNVVEVCRLALEDAGADPAEVAGVGISNQRETTVAWDAETGEPVCDAIVWQCSRAKDLCEKIFEQERSAMVVHSRTGLELSPYYPAAKMMWIMRNVDGCWDLARAGRLRLGTIDSWLVWNMTEGEEFRCDYSNASRTQLFDIDALAWSGEVCSIFGIDPACLPTVTDSDAYFGSTTLNGLLSSAVPIHGVLGDSHAALFGQGCLVEGQAKTTYGTGSSVMMNVGERPVRSERGLSTSLAWRMGGVTNYVLEGNINYTGAVISWLKDDLGLIQSTGEVEPLCRGAVQNDGLYFVPAFSGLGAPHWASDATARIVGMTRTTRRAEVVRAATESIAYQIADVVIAMEADSGIKLEQLRVDGGPTANGYLMQFQSDLLETPIHVPEAEEMSALGAGWCAGIGLGLFGKDVMTRDAARSTYAPVMDESVRAAKLAGWGEAVKGAIEASRR